MASKAERLRKAYEFKLGKDLAAKLSDSQVKLLSQYYNSLSDSEQSDLDNKIAMGMSNDLTDMARGMAEENEQDMEEPPAPPEGPPEDELEPEGPSGAITLYEGVRETDLVNEDIDETILRALGLEDVFDIDYGTYRTLLKERMMADRMGQKMDAGEAEAITEEFKRIKGKVGRFRIKKQKVETGNIASPTGGGSGSAGMKNFLALKGDAPEAPAQEAPKENFTKINSILDEILSTIKNLFNFERDNERRRQQEEGKKRKQGREDKLEGGSGIAKALKNVGKEILKPLQGPLDYILNWIKYTFLGTVIRPLLEWFGNPDNQGKIQAIGRFLKDWWPALVAAYLIFGNSISRSILKLTGILIKGAAKLLKVAIPKLLSLVRRNPKAAAAAALFTAGATIPMLMPDTVDEQERKIAEKPGDKEDKIKQLKEQKANLNIIQQMQGVGSEIDEQIFKLETGETKKYEEGGEVEKPAGFDFSSLFPLLDPNALGNIFAEKGDSLLSGISDFRSNFAEKTGGVDPLIALGPMAFPMMMGLNAGKKRKSTASNQDRDPARDITTNSGTDVTGAGVDTQLVPARPGDIVMNKEAVDAVGPQTFDTISANSGARITGAGPDTQMIAARPGEIIINKETVNRVGPGFFLGLNKQYGGSNANKPKTAKVQTASGGGFVLPAFSSGGMLAPGEQRDKSTTTEALGLPKDSTSQEIKAAYDAKHGEGSYEKKIKAKQSESGIKFETKPSEPLIPSSELEGLSTEQLRAKLDPTVTGAANPQVFNAAKQAREQAKAAGLSKEQIEKKVLIATIRAKLGSGGTTPAKPVISTPTTAKASAPTIAKPESQSPLQALFSAIDKDFAPSSTGYTAPKAKVSEQKPGNMITNMISSVLPIATPVMGIAQGIGRLFGGKKKKSGLVKENSGTNIPGATADRQHIDAQPGEYVLPVQTVMALGGPTAVDKLVANTDSNSTPAKLAPASAKKPIPGPPVPEGTAQMTTLPAITQSAGGGSGGKQTERKTPSFSATSPYTGDRQNNADIYGIR